MHPTTHSYSPHPRDAGYSDSPPQQGATDKYSDGMRIGMFITVGVLLALAVLVATRNQWRSIFNRGHLRRRRLRQREQELREQELELPDYYGNNNDDDNDSRQRSNNQHRNGSNHTSNPHIQRLREDEQGHHHDNDRNPGTRSNGPGRSQALPSPPVSRENQEVDVEAAVKHLDRPLPSSPAPSRIDRYSPTNSVLSASHFNFDPVSPGSARYRERQLERERTRREQREQGLVLQHHAIPTGRNGLDYGYSTPSPPRPNPNRSNGGRLPNLDHAPPSPQNSFEEIGSPGISNPMPNPVDLSNRLSAVAVAYTSGGKAKLVVVAPRRGSRGSGTSGSSNESQQQQQQQQQQHEKPLSYRSVDDTSSNSSGDSNTRSVDGIFFTAPSTAAPGGGGGCLAPPLPAPIVAPTTATASGSDLSPLPSPYIPEALRASIILDAASFVVAAPSPATAVSCTAPSSSANVASHLSLPSPNINAALRASIALSASRDHLFAAPPPASDASIKALTPSISGSELNLPSPWLPLDSHIRPPSVAVTSGTHSLASSAGPSSSSLQFDIWPTAAVGSTAEDHLFIGSATSPIRLGHDATNSTAIDAATQTYDGDGGSSGWEGDDDDITLTTVEAVTGVGEVENHQEQAQQVNNNGAAVPIVMMDDEGHDQNDVENDNNNDNGIDNDQEHEANNNGGTAIPTVRSDGVLVRRTRSRITLSVGAFTDSGIEMGSSSEPDSAFSSPDSVALENSQRAQIKSWNGWDSWESNESTPSILRSIKIARPSR